MPENAPDTVEQMAARIRGAFSAGDVAALEPLFAPEARWGNCLGGRQIIKWMEEVRAGGIDAALVDIDPMTDRIVLAFDLRDRHADEPAASPPQPHYQVAFVVDGQVIELQDAADHETALLATPGAPPPSPLGPRSGIGTAAAIFPVRDLTTALEHYRQLGFTVHAYEGGGYGFIERGHIELHLGEQPDLDPRANLSAVYLTVDDADAVAAEWRTAQLAGQLIEPVQTDYGMREGTHIDPDGNRIRFGSPIGS